MVEVGSLNALLHLGMRHMLHKRRRLLLFICLFALTCVQFLFFGAERLKTIESGIAQVDPLNLQYYDMMLVLREKQTLLTQEEMPRPLYDRHIVREMANATLLALQSDWGELRILALPESDAFFQFTEGELQGRQAQTAQEIVIPQSWAEVFQLHLGDILDLEYREQQIWSWQPTLVGIYHDVCDLPVALTRAFPFPPGMQTNALLINTFAAEDRGYLAEWMQQVYPGATPFYNEVPLWLGEMMLRQIRSPALFLPTLLYFFMGIGILSLTLLSFLERRKELAILKTLGLSRRQSLFFFSIECAYGILGGIILSTLLIALLASSSQLFVGMTFAQILSYSAQGMAYCILVALLSLTYPLILAKIATVEQLQYERPIPFSMRDIDYMEWPTGDLVLRERTESIRFLRVPYDLSEYLCLLLKSVGDRVKKGETIAVAEYWQGYVIERYVSPCDGRIEAINGALIALRADSMDAPRYPYPNYLVEDEQRRMELIRRVREEVRRAEKQRKEKSP